MSVFYSTNTPEHMQNAHYASTIYNIQRLDITYCLPVGDCYLCHGRVIHGILCGY